MIWVGSFEFIVKGIIYFMFREESCAVLMELVSSVRVIGILYGSLSASGKRVSFFFINSLM